MKLNCPVVKVTLSRLVEYGAVPPDTVTVMVPSLSPKQISGVPVTDAVSAAAGSVTVTVGSVTSQPMLSFTFTV